MNVRWQTIGVGALRLAAVALMAAWPAVSLAAEHTSPTSKAAAGPTEKRIAQLIAQLGDNDYSVRQRAQDQIAKLGFQAFDALTAASNNDDFEIASRARYLLRLIRAQSSTDKDPPEARTLILGYELLSEREREQRIGSLIQLPSLGGIPVVCRLIRFERSNRVAHDAALELLQNEPLDQVSRAKWSRIVRENLTGAQRRPARWLIAYLELRDHPAASIKSWSRLVEDETRLLRSTPDQTVAGAAPMLAYLLAEAYLRQGDHAKAQQAAQQALQLGGSADEADLFTRIQTASALRRRGLIAWAEAEYRRIAETGPTDEKVLAWVLLSEMLHDQGESLAAAEVARQAVESLQKLSGPGREQFRDTFEIRARMHYFLACHWEKKGDRAKQRECLNAAIHASPREVDTLIALYKLPDQTKAERDKTRKLINQAVASLRQEVERDNATGGPDPNSCNQLAWLMGNTQTNLDEALRLAKKACELSPDNGAYLDTLAHVYFAKGDTDNAVRYETRAVEVDPHSGLIVSELKVFRAAAQQRKKSAIAPSPPNRKG